MASMCAGCCRTSSRTRISHVMSYRQRLFAIVFGSAALAAAVLAGCGKQGPPLPPLKAVPATTKDLVATQQGSQIMLSFSYPTTTAAGLALPGIFACEVLDATRQAGADGKPVPMDPKQFAVTGKLLTKVEGADLTAATSGDRIVISLPVPPPPPPAKPVPAATPKPA